MSNIVTPDTVVRSAEEWAQPRGRHELIVGDSVKNIWGEVGRVINTISFINTIKLSNGDIVDAEQFDPDWSWHHEPLIETSWGDTFVNIEDLEDAIRYLEGELDDV